MIVHKIKVYPSKIHLPKKNQLAWKIAEIASDKSKLDKDAIEMSINRIIDFLGLGDSLIFEGKWESDYFVKD